MSGLRNNNTTWRRLLREALVAGRLIERPGLVMTVQERHPGPDELRPGQMIVVVSGGRPAWAYFQCPGNCGSQIQLSLDLRHPPRWLVKADFLARPTISSAVYCHRACCAQFTIDGGRVGWLGEREHRHCAPVAANNALHGIAVTRNCHPVD